jgi:hypothetical protein
MTMTPPPLPHTPTANQPRPGTAVESALDVVKVPSTLAESAATRLKALGIPCQTTAPSSTHRVFLVPAGSDTLPWPASVTYLTGSLWPIAPLDASHRASDAYRALVTPPTALYAALAALSSAPAPDTSPPSAADAKPSLCAVSPDRRARQTRGDQ